MLSSMSQITLGSADWNFWPITRDYSHIFGYVRDLHIQSVELGIYQPSQELAPRPLKELTEKAKSSNLQITAVLFSLTSDLWGEGAFSNNKSRFLEEFKFFLTALETQGIKCANVWTGVDLVDSNPEEVAKTLTKMNLLAQNFSGTVSIEYKEGTYFQDAQTTLDLLQEFENLKILLDTGHAYALNENPENLVELLSKHEKLGSIHLGDAQIGESDDDLPCGRIHNFGLFVEALENLHLPIVANFDLYGAAMDPLGPGPRSIVTESLRHLQDCGL